jgi:hypothetical protein
MSLLAIRAPPDASEQTSIKHRGARLASTFLVSQRTPIPIRMNVKMLNGNATRMGTESGVSSRSTAPKTPSTANGSSEE